MSIETKWFEDDGNPRYGALTQREWYEQVRLELEGHTVCEANMDAEVERLRADRQKAEEMLEDEAREVERLRAVNAEKLAAIHRYQDENDRLQASRDRHKAFGDKMEAEVERLRTQVAEVKVAGINGRAEATAENERLRAERQEMFEAWQAELSVVERLRADSRNERERLKTEIRRLRFRSVEYAAAVTNAETLKAEVARLRASRTSLADDVTRLTDEVERMRADNDELHLIAEQATRRTEEALAEREGHARSAKRYAAEVERLRAIRKGDE